MNRYAVTKHCRELFLRRYFGEMDGEVCGKCDNCIQSEQRYEPFTNEDVVKVQECLTGEAVSIKTISEKTGISGRNLKRLIHYMVREEQIGRVEDQFGNIRYRLNKR